ncbi:hypothetical protein L3X38_033577 [Prunus dulcis]|uniref:Uncharacterized protein n=1 Tax=Prunus dulcis TaxID=3755 RepID=A0AAD4YX32_PRUDU|nr:hypothetical protein L3X38_033577 [Prunus dulcis]
MCIGWLDGWKALQISFVSSHGPSSTCCDGRPGGSGGYLVLRTKLQVAIFFMPKIGVQLRWKKCEVFGGAIELWTFSKERSCRRNGEEAIVKVWKPRSESESLHKVSMWDFVQIPSASMVLGFVTESFGNNLHQVVGSSACWSSSVKYVRLIMGKVPHCLENLLTGQRVNFLLCTSVPLLAMKILADFLEIDNLRPKLLISKQAIVNLGEEYLPTTVLPSPPLAPATVWGGTGPKRTASSSCFHPAPSSTPAAATVAGICRNPVVFPENSNRLFSLNSSPNLSSKAPRARQTRRRDLQEV